MKDTETKHAQSTQIALRNEKTTELTINWAKCYMTSLEVEYW